MCSGPVRPRVKDSAVCLFLSCLYRDIKAHASERALFASVCPKVEQSIIKVEIKVELKEILL